MDQSRPVWSITGLTEIEQELESVLPDLDMIAVARFNPPFIISQYPPPLTF